MDRSQRIHTQEAHADQEAEVTFVDQKLQEHLFDVSVDQVLI